MLKVLKTTDGNAILLDDINFEYRPARIYSREHSHYRGEKNSSLLIFSIAFPLDADLLTKLLYCKINKKPTALKLGCINENGEVIVKPVYDDILLASEDIFMIKIGEIKGYIDSDGILCTSKRDDKGRHYYEKLELKQSHDLIASFYCGMAISVTNGKYGIISSKLEILVPDIYDEIPEYRRNSDWENIDSDSFSGIVLLKRNGKSDCALVIKSVVLKILKDFDLGSFYDYQTMEGFRIKRHDKYGFMNFIGDIVLDVEYDSINKLCPAFLLLKNQDKYGICKFDNFRIEFKTNCMYDLIYSGLTDDKQKIFYTASDNRACLRDVNWNIIENIPLLPSNYYLLIDTYSEKMIGLRIKHSYKCVYTFMDMNGVENEKISKLHIRNINRGFKNGVAQVELDDFTYKGYKSLDGYYEAEINLDGKILSKKYIDCDLRDYSDDDNWTDNHSLSDAFEGDIDALWNID